MSLGSLSEIKEVYGSKSMYCSCCTVWNDKKATGDDIERTETGRDRYAIIKRQKKHGAGSWKTHSVVINSPYIRKHMQHLFSEYPSVDFSAETLDFEAPFLPFAHRWEDLQKIYNNEVENTTKIHLKLLIDTLACETGKTIKALETIRKTGHVTFSNINLFYIIGEPLIQDQDSPPSAGMLRDIVLRQIDGAPAFWVVSVNVVDWNGQVFGVTTRQWTIPEYKGSRTLKQIGIRSVRDSLNVDQTRKQLIARGRIFEQLAGCHLKSYDGKAEIKGYDSYIGALPGTTMVG